MSPSQRLLWVQQISVTRSGFLQEFCRRLEWASATVFTTLAILTTIIEDRKFAVPYTAWKHSAPAALASVCAFLFLLHALAIGQASVLVPIAQMGSMVSVGLGVLFLGETMTPRKFGGLAAAIAALALLAAS
jgi:uncharacterized membrane protein